MSFHFSMENIKSLAEWNNIVRSSIWQGNGQLIRDLRNRYVQLPGGSADSAGTQEFWDAYKALVARWVSGCNLGADNSLVISQD